jgi:hypothetical protein
MLLINQHGEIVTKNVFAFHSLRLESVDDENLQMFTH